MTRRTELAAACLAGLMLTTTAGCTPLSTTGPNGCAISAGQVSGSPKMSVGTGGSSYIARANGDRFLGNFGQQGGAHVWLAFESSGLGPQVDATYRMFEPDGGTIYQGQPVPICLSASENGGQMAAGIQGFIDYTFPEPCSRILCGGPFMVALTVSDGDGHNVTDQRLVAGVDIGDDFSSTSQPDCAGATYDPKPTCEEGLR